MPPPSRCVSAAIANVPLLTSDAQMARQPVPETERSVPLFVMLAAVLVYFLMVALDKSFIVPLAVMLIVPLSLIGILPTLFVTGSAINVQSLLGFIFIK